MEPSSEENKDNQDLQYKFGNPGAVRYGNFINYYQFHPPENRIKLLPKAILDFDCFESDPLIVALDIGCNTGNLTTELETFLNTKSNCKMLGIDIDPTLIERAQDSNYNSSITFEVLDFTDNEKRECTIETFLKPLNRIKFDIIFCFSTTMWIHLNHGDDGLRSFLKNIAALTKFLIIEAQPWKCYKTALKRVKGTVFSNFKELKIRKNIEDEIEAILLIAGMKKIWESPLTQWGRRITCFKTS